MGNLSINGNTRDSHVRLSGYFNTYVYLHLLTTSSTSLYHAIALPICLLSADIWHVWFSIGVEFIFLHLLLSSLISLWRVNHLE